VPQFLSESWFSELRKIRAEVGDVPVPDAIKEVKLNVVVTEHPEGEKQLHMAAGEFEEGLLEGAPTKLTVPFPVAVAVFVHGDQAAAMQAFMSGEVKVEGDMSVMMRLQSGGPPGPQAEVLRKRVKEMTEA
jgi:hypothetical protein